MSTIIAIKENNKFYYIWSGDYGNIETVGKELRKYYNNTDQVRSLINSGEFVYKCCDDGKTKQNNKDYPKETVDFEEFLRKERHNIILFCAYFFDIQDNSWYVYRNLNCEDIIKEKLDDVIIERFLNSRE